jgi:hypothetical protein
MINSHGVSQVFENIRALFQKAVRTVQQPIDVNDLILGALRDLDGELKDHRIVTRVELTSELPPVMGHRGQLREVIINLVHNSIEAMDAINDDRRVLQLRTVRRGGDAIIMISPPTKANSPRAKPAYSRIGKLPIQRDVADGDCGTDPAHHCGVDEKTPTVICRLPRDAAPRLSVQE